MYNLNHCRTTTSTTTTSLFCVEKTATTDDNLSSPRHTVYTNAKQQLVCSPNTHTNTDLYTRRNRSPNWSFPSWHGSWRSALEVIVHGRKQTRLSRNRIRPQIYIHLLNYSSDPRVRFKRYGLHSAAAVRPEGDAPSDAASNSHSCKWKSAKSKENPHTKTWSSDRAVVYVVKCA